MSNSQHSHSHPARDPISPFLGLTSCLSGGHQSALDQAHSFDTAWQNPFQYVQLCRRPPAWTRVPVKASLSRNVRIIMKRIRIPSPREPVAHEAQEDDIEPTIQRKRRASIIENSKGKRTRLVSSIGDEIITFADVPPTSEQVEKMMADAKANVAKALQEESARSNAKNNKAGDKCDDTPSAGKHPRGLLSQLLDSNERDTTTTNEHVSHETAESDAVVAPSTEETRGESTPVSKPQQHDSPAPSTHCTSTSTPRTSTPCTRAVSPSDTPNNLVETDKESSGPQTPQSSKSKARVHFGDMSPEFTSPQFLRPDMGSGGSAKPARTGKIDHVSRRRSEPLIRKLFAHRANPLQPMSPQPVAFSNSVFSNDAHLEATPLLQSVDKPMLNPLAASVNSHTSSFTPDKIMVNPLRETTPLGSHYETASLSTVALSSASPVGGIAASQLGQLQTPGVRRRFNMAANAAATPAVAWSNAIDHETPNSTAQGTRQAVDLASSNADSQHGSNVIAYGSLPVDTLAQLAAQQCDGEAKVLMGREQGRLFIRFKLPIEYASKFQESQSVVSDESTPMEVDPAPAAASHMGQTMDQEAFAGDPMKICSDCPDEQSLPDSPSALAELRRPLGTKNPNLSSSPRGQELSIEKQTSRVRQMPLMDNFDDEMVDAPRTDAPGYHSDVEMADKTDKSDVEMADAPSVRRSSRLRALRSSHRSRAWSPKSSKTASTKPASRSGSGRGAKEPARAKAGASVASRTRANTSLNRGDGSSQVLARDTHQDDDEMMDVEHPSGTASQAKGNKSVGWREPLEAWDEGSRGKGRKARATQGKTAVEKGEIVTRAAQRKRASQVAAGLDLANKDTSGRVTRSRARAIS